MEDLSWIKRLQRVFSNEVGFLSTTALIGYIHAQAITIAQTPTARLGYLAGYHVLKWQPLLRPITQIAVDPSCHARHVATLLLADLIESAKDRDQVGVQAICRANLEANKFWEAKGFKLICHLTPDNARKIPLIVWRLPLVKNVPLWFCQPPKRFGRHATRPQPAQRKGVLNAGHNPARWILPTFERTTKTPHKKTPTPHGIPQRKSGKQATSQA